MPAGGNRGGGPLTRRIALTERSARYVRDLAAVQPPARFTRATAEQIVNQVLESQASGTAVYLPLAMVEAALPWIEEARRLCISDDGQRALDSLIAALWTAQVRKNEAE